MAHDFQFEKDGKPVACAVCEAMLPDAVDGTLSAAEHQAFDRHVAGCVECARELAEAQRGAAWLAMLKGNAPQPPAALLEKILAGTTGTIEPVTSRVAHPFGASSRKGGVEALRAKLSGMFSFPSAAAIFQPRMAMTAAMAFFSLALTLNLMGVRLGDVRAANFSPSGLRRSVADASASVSRTFQNNSTVYKMESSVSDLRGDDAPNGPSH